VVSVTVDNDVRCESCNAPGTIGKGLLGKPAGMVLGINMKRTKYLCGKCYKKMPIDKQESSNDKYR